MIYRFFLYSSYILPIFVLYSSYIKPSKWVVFIGLSGWEFGRKGRERVFFAVLYKVGNNKKVL